MPDTAITFYESTTFSKEAKRIFTARDLEVMKLQIAADPLGGRLIKGSGGLRIIQASAKGHGKSRGARVVYLYLGTGERIVFLVACYFGSGKDSFTYGNVTQWARIAAAIKAVYKAGKR